MVWRVLGILGLTLAPLGVAAQDAPTDENASKPPMPPAGPPQPTVTGAIGPEGALTPPKDREAEFRDLFFDDYDGKLDVSKFLARGGFIPIPRIITEPAVDYGLGLIAMFLKPPSPEGGDPRRRALGYLQTGNDSYGFVAFQAGSLMGGQWKYRAFAATGRINLDYYPGGETGPALPYTNEATIAEVSARYRFGGEDGKWYAGPILRLFQTDVRPDGPNFPDALSRSQTLNALGASVHYDDRDNVITPNDGLNVSLRLRRYDEAFGSDAEFTQGQFAASYFKTFNDGITVGINGFVEGNSDGAPFFMQPSINLRGVAGNRYQGETVASTELEIRKQVNPRWSVLGFAGVGRALSGDNPLFTDASAYGVGAGFRYRVARFFGADVGIDIARGPEDTIFYIQFGHAWGRQMD